MYICKIYACIFVWSSSSFVQFYLTISDIYAHHVSQSHKSAIQNPLKKLQLVFLAFYWFMCFAALGIYMLNCEAHIFAPIVHTCREIDNNSEASTTHRSGFFLLSMGFLQFFLTAMLGSSTLMYASISITLGVDALNFLLEMS